MSPPRNMMQVKREDLYTDLEARIRYLHSFIEFGSNDIEALKSGAKYIKQLIPAVVNIVYKKLLQYDITARAFTTRSTSFEGPIDDVPDENSPQILHRKMFLRAYLAKLCSDPTQMEFWEYLDKVGMMHVGLGRAHPLHIEYIHLGICLAFIQDLLTEAILSHPKLQMQRKIALVKAIGKVIWIQNDLMAKWHIEDGDDFKKSDKEFIIEREGFLHGKKVLDDSEEENDEGSRTPQPQSPSRIPRPMASGESVCPFSGMSTGATKKEHSPAEDTAPATATEPKEQASQSA